jgi:hypothetical protein
MSERLPDQVFLEWNVLRAVDVRTWCLSRLSVKKTAGKQKGQKETFLPFLPVFALFASLAFHLKRFVFEKF